MSLINANALAIPLAAGTVQTCVTSPPYYGLRHYGVEGQIGLEATPEEFVCRMVEVGREIRRVLRNDGTWWLNLGDSYAGGNKGRGGGGPKSKKQTTNRGAYFETNKSKRMQRGPGHRWGGGGPEVEGLPDKNLMMIPARVALALQADGWWIRAEIVWAKPNPMPESITDRPTRSHEMIYLLTKQARYYYNHEAVKEPAAHASLEPLERGVSDHHKYIDGALGQYPHSFSKPRPNRSKGNRKSFRGGGDYTAAGGYSIDNDRPRNGNKTYGNAPNDTGMRNQRDVWTIATQGYEGAHYATFPTEIPERCILAGSRPGDLVLDPFVGSGTTGEVALSLGRRFVGLDLKMSYLLENAWPRLAAVPLAMELTL